MRRLWKLLRTADDDLRLHGRRLYGWWLLELRSGSRTDAGCHARSYTGSRGSCEFGPSDHDVQSGSDDAGIFGSHAGRRQSSGNARPVLSQVGNATRRVTGLSETSGL